MEKVDKINEWLERDWGKHEDGRPRFRVVWSPDQFEKRWVTHTKDGFEMLNPIVEERPKYRQWADERWILEQLSVVPEGPETDLIVKLSYEPLWVFQDAAGNPLPPRYDACKIIIENLYLGMKHAGRRYVEDPQAGEKELKRVEEMLTGNETSVTDALAYGYGVTVPGMPALDPEIKKGEKIH